MIRYKIVSFQSTLPARGATCATGYTNFSRPYFNPRSPHGERRYCRERNVSCNRFQSTLPARGATPEIAMIVNYMVFQSTLPARGATPAPARTQAIVQISIHAPRTGSDPICYTVADFCRISIHAPRTGSDTGPARRRVRHDNISIHAPRTGSDNRNSQRALCRNNFNPRSPHGERLLARLFVCDQFQFQSTLPARGATSAGVRVRENNFYFNPRSPHGERRNYCKKIFCGIDFNPRSPHGERPCTFGMLAICANFNPRSPHGERLNLSPVAAGVDYFNPRSPHGERHPPNHFRRLHCQFQSTLPARGATGGANIDELTPDISIHAPRTGSDMIRGR